MTATCPDCGAVSGALHVPFCLKERCPFCSGQLATCDCIFVVINLNVPERVALEEFKDDTVEPLRGILKRWRDALRAEGRIPYEAP